MAKAVVINLIAKDDVSGPMRKIAMETGKTADALEEIGDVGPSAMSDLADETELTAAAAQNLERRYTAIGAAAGAVASAVSKLGASYREQRLDLQSLNDQYGAASHNVIAFTEEIQRSLNQSNDAARDSALTFATFYRNYAMGEEQIIELMTRTADISAARGRSMTDTSQMIQNALRGEAEYIEQIGVTLNDTYVASEYFARGMGNWNTLTDEAAKAQFRYVLLMEQTSDTMGRASEESARWGGFMRRLINEGQDLGQWAGGMLGPLGEMGAEFSQIAIGIPVVTGALGKMVGMAKSSQLALGALSLVTGPVGIGLAAIGAAIAVGSKLWGDHQRGVEETRLAYDALQREMESTDQLISNTRLGGNTVMADLMSGMRDDIRDGWDEIAQIHQSGWENFWESLATMPSEDIGQAYVDFLDNSVGRAFIDWAQENEKLSLDVIDAILSGNSEVINARSGEITEALAEYYRGFEFPPEVRKQVEDEFNDLLELMSNPNVDTSWLWDEFNQAFAEFQSTGNVDKFRDDLNEIEQQAVHAATAMVELQASTDWIRDMNRMRLDGLGEMADDLDGLRSRFVDVNIATGDYADAIDEILSLARAGKIDIDAVSQVIANLNYGLATGVISQAEYEAGIVSLANSMNLFPAGAERIDVATEALTGFGHAVEATSDAAERSERALQAMLRTVPALGVNVNDLTADLLAMAEAKQLAMGAGGEIGTITGLEVGPVVGDLLVLEDTLQGILELTGVDAFAPFLVTAPELAGVAYNLERINTSLASTEQVIIGQTNAWASQSQGLADWATELINVEGTYGEIDRLLQQGLISQEKYNEAQLAHNSIIADNARIQDDVLAIQAAQSPVMADLLNKQANYVQQIREMNDGFNDAEDGAQQQLAALGMMDSGIQGTVGNILELGANLDNLGPQGVAAFEQMIQGAVAADPVLGAVLEQMGLISIGADGTVTVNLEGFDNANSEISRLTDSIVALIDLMDDGSLNGSFTLDVVDNATPAVDEVVRTARDYDGSTATGILNADGSPALGSIGMVDESIGDLDGRTATVNVVANDQASGVLAGIASQWGGTIATSIIDVVTRNVPGRALGGVVRGYASGGVPVELAERGGEILHFASGGTAYVANRGIYSVPVGTYVQPNHAIGSTNYGGITVDFSGAVFNNTSREDMNAWAQEEFVPMLQRAVEDRRTGMGVA